MLKFATYCAYISALGVKNNKTKGETMPCKAHSFSWDWFYTFGTDQGTFKQALALIRRTNYYYRQRVMIFNVKITIGAIISAQPLGSIIFRWFSDKKQGSRSARLSPQSMIQYARILFKCSIRIVQSSTILETTRWPNDYMTRWPDDQITILTRWPDYQMTSWSYKKMTRWNDDQITRWPEN